MLNDSATVFAAAKNGMRFVDEHAHAMRFGDVKQRWEIRHVSIHRIDTLEQHEAALSLRIRQNSIQRCSIIVVEKNYSSAADLRPIQHGKVRSLIGDGHVAFP